MIFYHNSHFSLKNYFIVERKNESVLTRKSLNLFVLTDGQTPIVNAILSFILQKGVNNQRNG